MFSAYTENVQAISHGKTEMKSGNHAECALILIKKKWFQAEPSGICI